MDLSIIVVNYGTYELTKRSIESVLYQNLDFRYEIFLVDNNSPDNSYEKLIDNFNELIEEGIIKPIANKTNQGFAVANNLAIKVAKGKFIILLNSDTETKKGTLQNCLYYIENHQNIGALGCKILLPNGKLDKSCKRSFPNPKNSLYRLFHLSKISKSSKSDNYNLDNLDNDAIYEVDSLVGAFMLVRKSTIDEVGFLDEDYFMYGEDIDWCYRIKDAGWKVVYYGKAEIVHYKGASSKKQKSKLIYEFYRSMYIFYNKHYKNEYSILTRIAVYFGITVLLVAKLFLNVFKR